MKEGKALRALRQLTWNAAGQSSAGRNSAGRITIFHRGGGSKRLQRTVDLKRSTSTIGVVERIEYDPNRSSRIALVRWIHGVQQLQPHLLRRNRTQDFAPPPRKIVEPTSSTVRGIISLASLPGKVDQRKATSAKDVFLSAFSSSKAKGETAASLSVGGSFNLPRIAIAAAKPAFVASQMREEAGDKNTLSPCEVRKWNPHSAVWEHRIKRRAALSWQSFKTLEFVGAVKHNESKPFAKPKKDGASKVDRAPVSYVIASHSLKPGQMVMNGDWSKPSTSGTSQSARNAYSF